MADQPILPPTTPPSPLKEIGVNLIDNPGQWLEEALRELTVAMKTFLPHLLEALALLLIGWLAAFFVRWLVRRNRRKHAERQESLQKAMAGQKPPEMK